MLNLEWGSPPSSHTWFPIPAVFARSCMVTRWRGRASPQHCAPGWALLAHPALLLIGCPHAWGHLGASCLIRPNCWSFAYSLTISLLLCYWCGSSLPNCSPNCMRVGIRVLGAHSAHLSWLTHVSPVPLDSAAAFAFPPPQPFLLLKAISTAEAVRPGVPSQLSPNTSFRLFAWILRSASLHSL